MAPLRESNPVKVALVVWLGLFVVVRGVPALQHWQQDRREDRAAARSAHALQERWRVAAQALGAVRLAPSMTPCPRDVSLPGGVDFPCWTGRGLVLDTAALLRSQLDALGTAKAKPDCVRLQSGVVWCELALPVESVLVRCSVRPENEVRPGSVGPSRTDVRVDCLPLDELGPDVGLPKRLPRVPLPTAAP